MARWDDQSNRDQAGDDRLVDRVFQELDRRSGQRRRKAAFGGTVVALVVAGVGGARLFDGQGHLAVDRTAADRTASRSADERARAYAELGAQLRYTGDPEAFELLRAGLLDSDRRARRSATQSLLHAIVPGRDSDKATREARAAVDSLIVAIGRPIAIDVAFAEDPLSVFVELSNLSAEEQTLCVLLLLEGMAPEEIVPYAGFVLSQVTEAASGRVRAQALRTARSTMPDWQGLTAVVQGFLETGTAAEKISAIQAVEDKEMYPLVDSVRARLADPDANVRLLAAQALARLGQTSAAADLAALADDPVHVVRIYAASALSELGFTEWNETLVKYALGSAGSSSGGSPKDRATALSELTRVSGLSAAEVGIAILSSTQAAATGAGLQENSTFSGAAASSDSRFVLVTAIRASRLSSDPAAGSLIASFMEDEDPMLVVEAAVALHLRGDPAGSARLIDWIIGKEPNEHARVLAIKAAERLEDEVFRPALEQAEQGDAAPANREAASEALNEIEGS